MGERLGQRGARTRSGGRELPDALRESVGELATRRPRPVSLAPGLAAL